MMPKLSKSSITLMVALIAIISIACVPGRSETVALPASSPSSEVESSELEIVTLLGYDAIPAIMSPEFVDTAQAEQWMAPDERVLGLSINGDNRAYSIPMLSRHEIVNDNVGGVPVAVTW